MRGRRPIAGVKGWVDAWRVDHTVRLLEVAAPLRRVVDNNLLPGTLAYATSERPIERAVGEVGSPEMPRQAKTTAEMRFGTDKTGRCLPRAWAYDHSPVVSCSEGPALDTAPAPRYNAPKRSRPACPGAPEDGRRQRRRQAHPQRRVAPARCRGVAARPPRRSSSSASHSTAVCLG